MLFSKVNRKLHALIEVTVVCAALVALLVGAAAAQSNPADPATAAPGVQQPGSEGGARLGMNAAAPAASVRLVLNAGDEGDVSVYGAPDMSQHVRVSDAGDISLPLVGKIHVAGMTTDEAQAAIQQKLADGGFLRDPHVTFYVREFASQRVAVSGEVMRPGLYPVLSSPRLYDLFLAAGGLTNKAGQTVTITHASDPQKPTVVTLSSDAATSAEANVKLQAGDSVVVAKAGIVYVMGEVNRPGGFVIEDHQPVTLLRAIAMAAGPTRMASLGHARVIHRTATGLESRDVDLRKILQAKSQDVALTAEDILFVPSSRSKAAAAQGTASALSILTQLAIYRF